MSKLKKVGIGWYRREQADGVVWDTGEADDIDPQGFGKAGDMRFRAVPVPKRAAARGGLALAVVLLTACAPTAGPPTGPYDAGPTADAVDSTPCKLSESCANFGACTGLPGECRAADAASCAASKACTVWTQFNWCCYYGGVSCMRCM
jgi:hypothetical protein